MPLVPKRFRSLAVLVTLGVVAWMASPAASAADSTNPADPGFWYGRAADGTPTIKLWFFWTSRCEHCRAARPFLEQLPERLPYVELLSRPTEGNAASARQQATIARALGADPTAVPAIFFCGRAQIGYDTADGVGATLVQQLADCRARLAADPGLLTRPVPVVVRQAGAGGGLGAGGVVAIAMALAFVGLIVAGVVMSRRSAAARQRARAARHGEHRGRKKR